MLPDDQEALLGDILIYAKKVLTFTKDVSQEAFAANEEKQFAVIRCLEIIGEAVSHLSPEAQKELSPVQVRLIRGMRNRLVHDYRNISIRIVWEQSARALSRWFGPWKTDRDRLAEALSGGDEENGFRSWRKGLPSSKRSQYSKNRFP